MAHVGTPIGLANQPATSNRFGKLLLNAIVILAIGSALAVGALFLSRATSVPAIDRGYDQIEAQRGATTLSGVTSDTSNAVEKAAAAKARAMSGVAADTSYDAVENLRALTGLTVDTNAIEKAAAAKARAMSGVAADTSYDAAEKTRAAAIAAGSSVWRCGNGLPCGGAAAAAPAVSVWRCGNGLPCGATNRP
jgi:hypothetical protein